VASLVSTFGQRFTLPAGPPLVLPPLSLLDVARPLIDLEGLTAQAQQANERLASAQGRFDSLVTMSESDGSAEVLAQLEAERSNVIDASAWATEAVKRVADMQRWEGGFTYLPELPKSAVETWSPDTTVVYSNLTPGQTHTKNIGSNQSPTLWYDPFVEIARDARGTMGFSSFSDLKARATRAMRALRAHEPWGCELEFWTGRTIPTNFHLSASPNTALTSPHASITAWSNPTPAAGTTLGIAVGLKQSLAALDQSIADADGGIGMVHATPFLVQLWSSLFFINFDSASKMLYTVNGNLIVPGYGYPGTGPDPVARTVADGATNNGSASVSSATAAFTTSDIGSTITGTGIPTGAYIIDRSSATVVVISAPATATASGLSVTVGAGVGSLADQRYQWAYATEMVYHLNGDVHTYPWDVRQAGPLLNQANMIDVRAERSHAFITNQLLRAAVFVDTTAP
jgi:hypothetical protein